MAGYLDIKEYSDSRNGNSQSFGTLRDPNLDLVNDGGQTVELGLRPRPLPRLTRARLNCPVPERPRQSRYPGGTAGGDYNDEQVFSGQSGTQTLVKSGVGRLKLSNSGNNFTNSGRPAFKLTMEPWLRLTRMLWVASNTVVINKGKLELEEHIFGQYEHPRLGIG